MVRDPGGAGGLPPDVRNAPDGAADLRGGCLRQNDPYPVPAMLQTEKYLKVQEIADYISETTAAQGRWRKSPAGFLSANPI